MIIELTGLGKRLDLNVEIPKEEKPIVPEEAFTLTGDCGYRFAYGGWDWFIEDFGDKIITKDIYNAQSMFSNCKVKEIPFIINLSSVFTGDFKQCFEMCDMEKLPVIKGDKAYSKGLYWFFKDCKYLNQPITLDWFSWYDWDKSHSLTGYSAPNFTYLFCNCHSLRVIEEKLLNVLWSNYTSYTSQLFGSGFTACYSLDELKGLYPPPITLSSNMFSSCFLDDSRLKDLTFALDNGNPYVRNWSNQQISLNYWVGYSQKDKVSKYLQYSGLTKDTEIKDNATYQVLKNNPDSWTEDVRYSRYNKRSALNTIKSLPDVSQGKSNKIVFEGNAGSLTDEGAINTLTEEEIAIATSKGWTVAYD